MIVEKSFNYLHAVSWDCPIRDNCGRCAGHNQDGTEMPAEMFSETIRPVPTVLVFQMDPRYTMPAVFAEEIIQAAGIVFTFQMDPDTDSLCGICGGSNCECSKFMSIGFFFYFFIIHGSKYHKFLFHLFLLFLFIT